MRNAFIFLILFFLCAVAKAQPATALNTTDSFYTNNFFISYDINIVTNKKKSVAETYNGAVKTVFVKNNAVKLRLVSLMRIQNIYYTYKNADTNTVATIVKESGKNKYKFRLDQSDWQLFNKKYEGAAVELSDDSLMILNRTCKKATLTLTDGTSLIAWYIPSVKNEALMAAEPMFAAIPGIVLQYEFHQGKKSILYTASEISFAALPSAYFVMPEKGYVRKKFAPGKTIKGNIEEEE
jgi:hypothetical protein